MKITFPHFGNTYLALQALFQRMDIDYIVPQPSNSQTLHTGSIYAPEEICLPYKIMLGNMIDGIQKGADTVLLPGSCGPCRFGEYGELMRGILARNFPEVELIVLDAPTDIGFQGLRDRIHKLLTASSGGSVRLVKALVIAYRILVLADQIEDECRRRSGYEEAPGELATVLMRCRRELSEKNNPGQLMECLEEYRAMVFSVKLEPLRNPIRIAIAGEIYTIIEAFSNHSIEDFLMRQHTSIVRTLSPSWWVKDLLQKPLKVNSRKLNRAAREYLPIGVGGHASECVGEAVLAAEDGMDGLIQIFPLGCMPEIVSKAVLNSVSRDKGLPVMSIIVDGLSSETGVMTRVEAFVDMLERRRRNQCIR